MSANGVKSLASRRAFLLQLAPKTDRGIEGAILDDSHLRGHRLRDGQMRGGFLQVGGLARAQHDLGAGLAQRLRHLQAQAARAAGDQGRLPGEVEELLDACGHGGLSVGGGWGRT